MYLIAVQNRLSEASAACYIDGSLTRSAIISLSPFLRNFLIKDMIRIVAINNVC